MLKHRIMGASIVLALAAGIVAGLLLSRPSAPQRLAAVEPAATQVPTQSAQGTPPPMPYGVTHPPTLVSLTDGGLTFACSTDPSDPAGHVGVIQWDPSRGWPRSPQDLFRTADVVVLGTAVETRSFWQKDDGHLPAPNFGGFDWASLTATNFRIDAVYKGAQALNLASAGGRWLQVIDKGADPASLTTCQNRASQLEGWPQPLAGGQQYVLFLYAAPNGLHEIHGPADRWPIIGGAVHPDHDLQAAARQSVRGTPMPLPQFIAAMQQ